MSSPTLTKTLAYVAGDWTAITPSGSAVPGISGDLTGKHVWLRQNLATTDTDVTPTLSSLMVVVNEEITGPVLYIGSQQISRVYVGTQEISKIVVGGP